MATENIPATPAAVKLWAGQFLLEFLPALEFPMKDLELLNVMAQIGHMLGGERFIWRMGKGMSGMQGILRGHARQN